MSARKSPDVVDELLASSAFRSYVNEGMSTFFVASLMDLLHSRLIDWLSVTVLSYRPSWSYNA